MPVEAVLVPVKVTLDIRVKRVGSNVFGLVFVAVMAIHELDFELRTLSLLSIKNDQKCQGLQATAAVPVWHRFEVEAPHNLTGELQLAVHHHLCIAAACCGG